MARDRILQIYRGTTAQNDAFTGAQGELTMDTARKEIRIHDGSTAGGNVVGLTPGFIAPFAGSTAPAGWLVCDGSAVSRTTYAKLFAVIGTTYGSGDGNTTFNLPKENDFPIGLPSSRYTDLSFGASATIYDAPANGFIALDLVFNSGNYIFGANIKSYRGANPWDYAGRVYAAQQNTFANSQAIGFFIPVLKGDGVVFTYSGTPNSVRMFRFVYAEEQQHLIKY